MKTIVTHMSPDLDAITSVWLIVRFMHGWENAEISFVPAGETLNGEPVDSDPDILHVDTGLGKFDHHQLKERTCAARRVLNHILDHEQLRKTSIEPLDRIIDVVTLYDNFGEAHFPDATADFYSFSLNDIIYGLKPLTQNNHEVVEKTLPMLDALLNIMKVKVSAEEEMKKGVTIQTKWGRTLVVETSNDEVLKQGLKSGYTLVVRKDTERGYVRIKSFPSEDFDLTPLYEKVIKADSKEARWYLHPTGNMLLNGSTKQDATKSSTLDVQALIAIIQKA